MRNLLITIFVVFVSPKAFAESIQVQVIGEKGQHLPYANVFINSKFCTLSNAEGMATLLEENLQLGDTITSTYLGMSNAFTIFDEQLALHKQCLLEHKEVEEYVIDSVVVNPSGEKDYSWKLYRKYVSTHPQILRDCIVMGDFEIEVENSNASKVVKGTFELENSIPRHTSSQEFPQYYFAAPAKVIFSTGDTIAISSLLGSSIQNAYSFGCNAIGQLHIERIGRQPHSYMEYLGMQERQHIFRYSNADRKYTAGSQIIFTSDEQTKALQSVRFTTMNVFRGDVTITTLECGCENYVDTRGHVVTIPNNIDASFIRPDGIVVNITLRNIKVSR